ncbi:MAG: PHP domain-containing protein [Vallitalea sp.]|nr:PHP domain-containing protein [Vallitalea sp.]
MDKYIDLHVHSTVSDGTYTPCELVKYASEKKLAAIALTDHDCIFGIEEAKECAKKYDIEVISGIEFSTKYKDTEIHILGLYIDETNEDFIKNLDYIVKSRELRNEKMIQKLNDHGLNITMKDVLDNSDSDVYTRAHFAKALYNKGYVKSLREAFDKYIGNDCPCYVSREKVTPKLAIDLIRSCKGVPILAHPTLYNMDLRQLDVLIKELVADGLLGIEGLYSLYNKSEVRYIGDFAKKYNLLISGGSDFHGNNKVNIDLGIGRGNLKIPYSILEKIKLRRKEVYELD